MERGEDGEGEEGDLVEAASLAEGDDVVEASDEGDELEDEETDEEDYLDLYEAAAETQLAFEEMFTRPPQGKPPHPEAEGADAWDPAPPSAALIEPGVERVRVQVIGVCGGLGAWHHPDDCLGYRGFKVDQEDPERPWDMRWSAACPVELAWHSYQ